MKCFNCNGAYILVFVTVCTHLKANIPKHYHYATLLVELHTCTSVHICMR